MAEAGASALRQGSGALHTCDTGRAGGLGRRWLLSRDSRLHTTSQVRIRKQAEVTRHEPKNTQVLFFLDCILAFKYKSGQTDERLLPS